MWTVGDLCCAARAKRPSDNAMAHLITGIHGRPHMPPGDDSLEQRQAARVRERGELTPEGRNRLRVRVQLGGTVVSFWCSQQLGLSSRLLARNTDRISPACQQAVLALFTVVWLVVDFLRREDKAPPPVSSLPDPAKSDYSAKMTAYILAWLGETSPALVTRVFAVSTDGISARQAFLAGPCHACTASSTRTASGPER